MCAGLNISWLFWNGCGWKDAMTEPINKLLKITSNATRATAPTSPPASPATPTTTPAASDAPPRRVTDGAGDPDCPICHGVGYVREEWPLGHPNFGKLQVCTCQLENFQLERAAQM